MSTMTASGYMGKILYIDLSTGKVRVEELTEEIAEKYIGGSGLGAKILFEETSAEVDPLGPENVLIFATGPITGTRVFSSSRFETVAKSPLTGIYGEASCGGYWGEKFKRSGYDALVIKGKAEKPVYIYIDEEKVQIKDASFLWGKDTFETTHILRGKIDRSIAAAVIGQAGENLVKISCIIAAGEHGRAVGRCGLGAVMGSKNLKAIVVNGKKKVKIAREDEVKSLMKKVMPRMRSGVAEAIRKFGTSAGFVDCENTGDLPIKNWYQGRWEEEAKKLSGQTMAETILVGRYHCARCVVGCGRVVEAADGPYKGMQIGGPEYETLGMLGSNCLIDDLPGIAKANELCNRYGLDTISTGGVISFAMEAYDRGLISKEDTEGVELEWGSTSALIQMIHQIAQRKGIGELLGEGVKRAAEKIGGYAVEFAIHTKGLEFPAHDPRAKVATALAYATSNRGACHCQAFTHDFENGVSLPDLGYPETLDRFAVEGKAEFVFKMQNLMSMIDSLTCCKFVIHGGVTVEPLREFLNYVTGWSIDTGEFLKTGERIFNLKRLYNVRCGISRKDDTLPPRILTHKRGGGTNILPFLNLMLSEYYQLRGWDEFGIPTEEKLEELGLKKFKSY